MATPVAESSFSSVVGEQKRYIKIYIFCPVSRIGQETDWHVAVEVSFES